MTKLLAVPATHIDRAWRDGAHALEASCATSGGDITVDQLKLLLSRGERVLIRMDDDGKAVGWAVFSFEQLPNKRVLHVYQLYAPNGHFERFLEATRQLAEAQGCSAIRCSAKPAQARLYRMRCGFKPVFETLEVEL